ncbi:hypothetical protein HB836_16735, partial [Listeria booriae]
MKTKTLKKILTGAIAFNVLSTAPLLELSAHAAEVQPTVETQQSNNTRAAVVTNMLQNPQFSYDASTKLTANWDYYDARANKILTWIDYTPTPDIVTYDPAHVFLTDDEKNNFFESFANKDTEYRSVSLGPEYYSTGMTSPVKNKNAKLYVRQAV